MSLLTRPESTPDESVTLSLQARIRTAAGVSRVETVRWEARSTAIIVCDMWDRHWCEGATQRVRELAPFMNGVLSVARRKGVFIVHAPSDTMSTYRDYPQRLRAMRALRLVATPQIVRPYEPPLPIDDSDGGCTTESDGPWKGWESQNAALTIEPEDAISDDGDEILNLFGELGIENVILMGVHTNMCILGRSFGLRRMVEVGKNVVLARDLTDSMYNPAMSPFVSHFRGTELVVEHIETYVCPTITSSDLTGEAAFKFAADI